MDLNRLNPRMAGTRLRQAQDAKKMQKVVEERLNKKGLSVPPYEFLELIGKGAYGRVYKSKNRETQQECAVKIIEVDQQDYRAGLEGKDETIKDFINETKILQTLKDNKARNVNQIFDAFSVDTQLWVVSEYCPGGSLTTLMKACNPPGLKEEFIIPIAREVAIALKYVHDAGIVHRDVKCANILVTEDGRIQLCDFGISGVLENQVSKRTTIIGTPHWMAPEMVSHLGSESPGISYGAEVDCWAFGSTVYEMATGRPPNSNVMPHKLGLTLNIRAPRLDANKYPQGLCDYVAFCLEQQPEKRPNATQIMSHPFVSETEEAHPTSKITKLIENFALWEQEGGQRSSLFDPNLGAQGPEDEDMPTTDEDWNFSTTVDFDRRMSVRFGDDFQIGSEALDRFDQMLEDHRRQRGGDALGRLFDPNAKPYVYGDSDTRGSDLPLRPYQETSTGNRETLIDMGDLGMPELNLQNFLRDPPTLKPRRRGESDTSSEEMPMQTARRGTQDWPTGFSSSREASQERKPRPPTMAWTFAAAQQEAEIDIPDESEVLTPPASMHQTARKDSLKPNDQTTKRSTMAWSFEEAQKEIAPAKRGTMNWSFEDAQKEAYTLPKHHASLTEPDASLEQLSPPQLLHAATMPVGSNLAPEPSASPDRASMIDLDDANVNFELPEMVRRPSTALSTTGSMVSNATQGNPFELESEIEIPIEPSRSSMHIKSQSEPTTNFLEAMGSKEDPGGLSDIDAVHNRSSSMNQSDRSDRERSTSRAPNGTAARYRPRRPTALQRHIADRQKLTASGDSTVPSSRGDSIDSTSTGPFPHTQNLSFGTSDDNSRAWQNLRESQHRRQKTSDGASTIASRSDNEGISIKPRPRPSNITGPWKPARDASGYILPYSPDKIVLLPDPPEEVARQEFARLWVNLQAVQAQNADVLEREYGTGIDEAEVEAEFGPRSTWAAAAQAAQRTPGSAPVVEEDSVRLSESSTLRSA